MALRRTRTHVLGFQQQFEVTQADLTLKKSTRITERLNLELRLDTFNLFNRVNLLAADPKLRDTTFGQSTSTYAARNMLLGARFNF